MYVAESRELVLLPFEVTELLGALDASEERRELGGAILSEDWLEAEGRLETKDD